MYKYKQDITLNVITTQILTEITIHKETRGG